MPTSVTCYTKACRTCHGGCDIARSKRYLLSKSDLHGVVDALDRGRVGLFVQSDRRDHCSLGLLKNGIIAAGFLRTVLLARFKSVGQMCCQPSDAVRQCTPSESKITNMGRKSGAYLQTQRLPWKPQARLEIRRLPWNRPGRLG